MFMTGCASVNPMAFSKDTQKLDVSKKSVLLMTIDVSRPDDSRYVPYPYVVKTETPNAQSQEDRLNFTLNKDTDTVKEGDHTVFLARMAFAPGKYKMMDITGMASAFPFIGTFIVPLRMDFEVKPNTISYIGRVTATLRPKGDKEFSAGPILPLIDQAATGMSGGTWDVSIDDMSEKDLALFRDNFPVLATTQIDKSMLPAFDRTAIQRWWDGEEPQENAAVTTEKVAAKGDLTH